MSRGSAGGGEPILTVRDLRTYFYTRRGVGRAVDGVSFDLFSGETLGLVGESGSGKSMTCMSLVRLNPSPASRVVAGEVRFHGTDLLTISDAEMRSYRGKHLAVITQDPGTALNPVFTIGEQVFESLRLAPARLRGPALEDRAVELLGLLRIPSPRPRLRNYPHQFSGGMRQRVVGAIALSRSPEIIIADEPTTALDATIQAAYLDVLRDVQRRLGVAIILVTHDFSIVASMCDRVAVMYAGKIVEMGPKRVFFTAPRHPYSEALMASVPDVGVVRDRLPSIEGQPPSVFDPPPGCRFHPRCPLRARLGNPARCITEEPVLRSVGPGHVSACHFVEAIGSRSATSGPVAGSAS